jgi:hypothetical protein
MNTCTSNYSKGKEYGLNDHHLLVAKGLIVKASSKLKTVHASVVRAGLVNWNKKTKIFCSLTKNK